MTDITTTADAGASPDTSEPLNTGELDQMLSFSEGEAEAPKEPGDTQGVKGEAAVEEPPAVVAAPTPPVAVPPKESDDVVALKAKLAELQGKVDGWTQAQAQNAPKPEKPVGETFPNYHMNVPDEIMAHLSSEDPMERKHGVAALAYGISMNLHANIRKEMQEQFKAVPVVVQRMMETRTTHQDVVKDFYGKFPQLNTPELRTLVANVTPTVMKELGAQSWTEQVRDAVGTRVLNALMGAVPKPAPAPTPPPRQPAVFGGTTRSGDVSSKDDPYSDVLALL